MVRAKSWPLLRMSGRNSGFCHDEGQSVNGVRVRSTTMHAASMLTCAITLASALPSIPSAGTGPKPKMSNGLSARFETVNEM